MSSNLPGAARLDAGPRAHAREDGAKHGLDELLAGLVAAIADEVAARLDRVLDASSTGPDVERWRLLTVDEVAVRLGRSERWVRERAKRGELPFVRLDGGALAFDLEDVRAFVLARRVPAVG